MGRRALRCRTASGVARCPPRPHVPPWRLPVAGVYPPNVRRTCVLLLLPPTARARAFAQETPKTLETTCPPWLPARSSALRAPSGRRWGCSIARPSAPGTAVRSVCTACRVAGESWARDHLPPVGGGLDQPDGQAEPPGDGFHGLSGRGPGHDIARQAHTPHGGARLVPFTARCAPDVPGGQPVPPQRLPRLTPCAPGSIPVRATGHRHGARWRDHLAGCHYGQRRLRWHQPPRCSPNQAAPRAPTTTPTPTTAPDPIVAPVPMRAPDDRTAMDPTVAHRPTATSGPMYAPTPTVAASPISGTWA